MSETKIEEGDFVEVYLDAEGNNVESGVVLYHPYATGDAWHIQRKDGMLIYIQTYAAMYRKPTPQGVSGE